MPPMAAVPPTQNCLSVVFINPGDNSGFTVRFLEQLFVPFRSEMVRVYPPANEMVTSFVAAVNPEGPVQE